MRLSAETSRMLMDGAVEGGASFFVVCATAIAHPSDRRSNWACIVALRLHELSTRAQFVRGNMFLWRVASRSWIWCWMEQAAVVNYFVVTRRSHREIREMIRQFYCDRACVSRLQLLRLVVDCCWICSVIMYKSCILNSLVQF